MQEQLSNIKNAEQVTGPFLSNANKTKQNLNEFIELLKKIKKLPKKEKQKLKGAHIFNGCSEEILLQMQSTITELQNLKQELQ